MTYLRACVASLCAQSGPYRARIATSVFRENKVQALKLGRIGQISRTVKSIEQSKDWYGRILGLPHLYSVGKLACFDCNGTRLALTEGGAPGPESTLYLSVENIGRAHDELKSRGVVFVRAPHL